ncbi:hypothetical protein DCC79_00665 [bacterium]|nr:hypothetical protein [Chloroflexi bacterium CFX6]RIL12687.1 MAG: hypothetical protein DCC79_00665 [bacterium]
MHQDSTGRIDGSLAIRLGRMCPSGPPRRGSRFPWLAALLMAVVASPFIAPARPGHGQPGTAPSADRPASTGAARVAYLPLAFNHGLLGVVGPVRANRARGLHDAPFDLVLSSNTAGATIRYTLDGSLPTEAHGQRYTGPITIDRTTTLRAAAFAPGYAPSPIETRSFLFPTDVAAQSNEVALSAGLPLTWGIVPDGRWAGQAVPSDYGVRAEIIARHGDTLAAALRSLPSVSIAMDPDDLFDPATGIYSNPTRFGDAWERPASIEWLGVDGGPDLQIDAGVRIAGGYSRRPEATPKHSLSLRFRSRYGASRLRYPVFKDSAVQSFDTLRLRAGQADHFNFAAHKAQYLHDQWGRDTQADMGWPTAHGAFVHVYLNGLYWGIYNVAEEPTAAFAASHLGGDEDDWDVVRDGELVDGRWSVAVEDGDARAFEAMLDVARQAPEPDPMDRARFEQLARWLDLPQFIDYHLIQIHAANWDWPNKNWRAARNRDLGNGFQFFVWDMEHTTALRDDPDDKLCVSVRDPRTGACGFKADTLGVQDLHGWLMHFPDYRIAFADRVQRHFFAPTVASADARYAGALAPAATTRRYARLADMIEPAIVAESARWSTADPTALHAIDFPKVWERYHDRWPYGPQTPDHWRLERDRVLTRHFPDRTAVVLQQLCDEGLFPPVAPPALTVDGDPLEPQQMALTPSAVGCRETIVGTAVYYTLDGSDPRTPWSGDPAVPWSGEPSPTAAAYRGTVKLPGYAHVRARAAVHVDGRWRWSAQVEARLGHPRLAVSEIMYHPEAGGVEFIELHNREPATVDISGLRVSDAVRFTAPEGATVAPGGRFVITADATAFRARYPGITPDGVFDGKLDNAGETIVVTDAGGLRLAEVTYRSDGLWPRAPDGWGWSLVPRGYDVDLDDPEAWRASVGRGGAPGAADPDPMAPEVVVNEVLADSTEPLEDAIELHNLGVRPADIGGWFLSDDASSPLKFRIPAGTVVAPGGYTVFYEGEFGTGARRFALSADGESVVLTAVDAGGALTGVMRGVDFGAAAEGVSLGRQPTSAGVDFVRLARRSFGVDAPATVADFRRGTGAPNAPAHVGPIVINELMVDPAPSDMEYVELHNRTDAPVDLSDTDGFGRWRLQDGITLTLPAGLVLPAGGFALVVGGDPDRFRQLHAVPPDVAVLGPFDGKLGNDGDTVVLARVADDDTWRAEDRVRYRTRLPWPVAPARAGTALERLAPDGYGNEPHNWAARRVGGTPGRPNTRLTWAFLPWVRAGE